MQARESLAKSGLVIAPVLVEQRSDDFLQACVGLFHSRVVVWVLSTKPPSLLPPLLLALQSLFFLGLLSVGFLCCWRQGPRRSNSKIKYHFRSKCRGGSVRRIQKCRHAHAGNVCRYQGRQQIGPSTYRCTRQAVYGPPVESTFGFDSELSAMIRTPLDHRNAGMPWRTGRLDYSTFMIEFYYGSNTSILQTLMQRGSKNRTRAQVHRCDFSPKVQHRPSVQPGSAAPNTTAVILLLLLLCCTVAYSINDM